MTIKVTTYHNEGKACEVAEQLNNAIHNLIPQALHEEGSKDRVTAAYIGSVASISSLSWLAALVAPKKDSGGIPDFGPQTMLFASLLAYTVGRKSDLRQMNAALGPENFYQAMGLFQHMTGYAPDPYLDEGLVSMTREYAAEKNLSSSSFMAIIKEGRQVSAMN